MSRLTNFRPERGDRCGCVDQNEPLLSIVLRFLRQYALGLHEHGKQEGCFAGGSKQKDIKNCFFDPESTKCVTNGSSYLIL